jgi:xanthine dehydrogenase accessory factor
MYEIALSVSACVRGHTRADIAWLISSTNSIVPMSFDAIAMTPGGGKIGSLVNSAFDGPLIEHATRKLPTGRILTRVITDFESTIADLPTGTSLKFAVLPSDLVEPALWQSFLDRESVAIVCHIDGDEIVRTDYFNSVTIIAAEPEIAENFNKNESMIVELEDKIVTIYHPVTRLVIAGQGPIAQAIEKIATALGWNVSIHSQPSMFAGLAAGLSPMDCAIIMGHDVDTSSQCLSYALESSAGYIGALGSLKMQDNRADWLAYRDVTDLSRVHGPAGFSIGASTPDEIAISILAEAISVLKGV